MFGKKFIAYSLILGSIWACNKKTAKDLPDVKPLETNTVNKDTTNIVASEIKKTVNVNDFIPEGYNLFEEIKGDLNNDGLTDHVLIIKNTLPEDIVVNSFDKKVDRNRRGIIVLFKTKDGFNEIVKNYKCFSSENEEGGNYFPPELVVEIIKNKLYVHYAHGRYGYWRYTFRFNTNDFELIGYDASNNFGPIVNSETSINFLTKKKLEKVNVNERAESGEEVFESTWTAVKINKLLKLSDIKDFDDLEIYNY